MTEMVVEAELVEAVFTTDTTELVLEVVSTQEMIVEVQDVELVVEAPYTVDVTLEQLAAELVIEDVAVQELVVELEGPPGQRGTDGQRGVDGQAGVAGAAGPIGPTGTVVLSGGNALVFTQSTPASIWVKQHPFPYRPDVTTYDNGGDEIIGDVHHPFLGVVQVSFGFEMTGTIRLL